MPIIGLIPPALFFVLAAYVGLMAGAATVRGRRERERLFWLAVYTLQVVAIVVKVFDTWG